MKKTISMLLVLSMLLFIAIVPACAEATENNYLYEERFVEEYSGRYGSHIQFYDELYYHHTDANDLESPVDWALVYAVADMWDSFGFTSYVVIGDKVMAESYYLNPFMLGHAVYDVEKDEFIDLKDVDLAQYEGLEEYCYALPGGFFIGDIDLDRELSVIDATIIQRCIAQLQEFPEHDVCERHRFSAEYGTEKLAYFSDVDRDGERTVMDATAIQKKLAKIEI